MRRTERGRARSPSPDSAGRRRRRRPRRRRASCSSTSITGPTTPRTAQHLTDLAESLADRGARVPRPLLQGRHIRAAARPCRPTRSTTASTSTGSAPTAFGRRSTLRRMIDYLSFYFRRGHAGAAPAAVRRRRSTLTTPPIIGLIGTILAAVEGDAARLLEHGPPPRRQHRARADVAAEPGRRARSPGSATRSTARPTAWSSSARTWPTGSPRSGSAPTGSRRSRLEPARRDLPHAPRRAPAAAVARPGRQVRGDVLGQPRPGPRVRRVPRGRPTAPRIATTSSSCSSATARGMEEVVAAKEAEGLDNIRLLDYFPREQLHASLSVADVHLISMRREMTGIVVPCKLYGAMASGRPTLFVGPEHCESADTIREAGCGRRSAWAIPTALVDALDAMAADPGSWRRHWASVAARRSWPRIRARRLLRPMELDDRRTLGGARHRHGCAAVRTAPVGRSGLRCRCRRGSAGRRENVDFLIRSSH